MLLEGCYERFVRLPVDLLEYKGEIPHRLVIVNGQGKI
jgi:hypothetical protein